MDKNFRTNGYRVIDFTLYKSNVDKLRREWKRHVKLIPEYPGGFRGRGIVMCAGGLGYFTCCWIAVKAIRRLGCMLPIEVWYVGKELSEEVRAQLRELEVECKDFLEHGADRVSGYRLKPLAILKSGFREVLYLDADNVCVKNPTDLFGTAEYAATGALFWPDFWRTEKDNPIWAIIGSEEYDTMEQESGQVLIDKERCWKELNLCQFFNDRCDVYYRLLLGDKDTFRFAWMALKTPFHMIRTEVATCGYRHPDTNRFIGVTMVQHNPRGEPCFLHRNLLKWDITRPRERAWQKIRRFKPEAILKEYHINFAWELGHAFMDIQGEVEEVDFRELVGDIEDIFLDILRQLRNSAIYARYIMHLHFARHRLEPASVQVQEQQISPDSDYIGALDEKFVV